MPRPDLTITANAVAGGKNARGADWITNWVIPKFTEAQRAKGVDAAVRFEQNGAGDEDFKTKVALDLKTGGGDIVELDGIWLGRPAATLDAGRTVAASADVLLPDEPLSNLDARLRLAGRTFSGRIRQLGTPREVFQLPADTFVANFIGSTPMNLIEGRARNGRVECAGAHLPGPPGLADGTPVPADDGITGRVVAVENLGVSSSGRSRPPPSGAAPVRATA